MKEIWKSFLFVEKVLMFILILLFVLLLTSPFWVEDEEDFRKACEDVGGNYEVIGQGFSPAVKMNVDIYGCVK